VPVAVTGAIAVENIMEFTGKIAGWTDIVSNHGGPPRYTADNLRVQHGGYGVRITSWMAYLGVRSVLVGAAGHDFTEHGAWLEQRGVDTSSVRISCAQRTAAFYLITDASRGKVVSYYPGAMTEASEIDLVAIAERAGGFDLVVIGPNDPKAMIRHTRECREAGIPFAADPSDQLAYMTGQEIKDLVRGAAYLFGNEEDKTVLEETTGWSHEEVLREVGVRITTLGSRGARLDRDDTDPVVIPAGQSIEPAGYTAAGCAFRAGFLVGLSWRLAIEHAVQLGNLVAAHALGSAHALGGATASSAAIA
jgi:adenosine kinase